MIRQEALTSILEAEVALDQWDASPSVGLMAEQGEEFRLVPVQLSERFWTSLDPASMLDVLARAIVHPQRMAGGISLPVEWPEGFRLTGVALFTEGWGLDLTGLPPKAKDKALKLSETRQLSTHPNRVEIKMIAAQDVSGGRYSISWRRGAPGPLEMHQDIPGGYQLSGRVFDGLEAILSALQRVGI
jgi:hypothetical protein